MKLFTKLLYQTVADMMPYKFQPQLTHIAFVQNAEQPDQIQLYTEDTHHRILGATTIRPQRQPQENIRAGEWVLHYPTLLAILKTLAQCPETQIVQIELAQNIHIHWCDGHYTLYAQRQPIQPARHDDLTETIGRIYQQQQVQTIPISHTAKEILRKDIKNNIATLYYQPHQELYLWTTRNYTRATRKINQT